MIAAIAPNERGRATVQYILDVANDDGAEEYLNVLKECKRSLKNSKWNSEDECLQALRQRINNSEKLDQAIILLVRVECL